MPNMLACPHAILATMVPRTQVVLSDRIHCRVSSAELSVLIGVVAVCVIALILMSEDHEDSVPDRSNNLNPTGNPRLMRAKRRHEQE